MCRFYMSMSFQYHLLSSPCHLPVQLSVRDNVQSWLVQTDPLPSPYDQRTACCWPLVVLIKLAPVQEYGVSGLQHYDPFASDVYDLLSSCQGHKNPKLVSAKTALVMNSHGLPNDVCHSAWHQGINSRFNDLGIGHQACF